MIKNINANPVADENPSNHAKHLKQYSMSCELGFNGRLYRKSSEHQVQSIVISYSGASKVSFWKCGSQD